MEKIIGMDSTNKGLIPMIKGLLDAESVTHLNITYYEQGKQDSNYSIIQPISTKLIEVSKIEELDKLSNKDDVKIGLSSLVRLSNGYIAHIKQLDLDWNNNDLDFIFQKIKKLDLGKEGGYLINSGRGYHYYGKGLLTPEEWEDWMNKAEKSEEVDREWIRLSRERKYSVLRINSTEGKPIKPKPICGLSFY